MRIDKFLSNYGIGSRSEVKSIIKSGRIKVNNQVVKNPSLKINPKKDKVYFDNTPLEYKEYYYYMLNKPAGYITAKTDNLYPVVMEFFQNQPFFETLFPVGRLDLDTEGLLIVTNDGIFSHRVSHPKWEVEKEYYAVVSGDISKRELSKFEQSGIYLKKDKYQTKPFKIYIKDASSKKSQILIKVKEGKYHIVKKIMEEIGHPVLYLKRTKIGNLELDESLKPGEFRELKPEEIKKLKGLVNLT